MEKLTTERNGAELNGFWQMDSAYEAKVISRAYSYEDDSDAAANARVGQTGLKPIYDDEVAFARREFDLALMPDRKPSESRVLVGNAAMQQAVLGLRMIAGKRETYRGINPATADLFINVIDRIEAGHQPLSAEKAIGITATAYTLSLEQMLAIEPGDISVSRLPTRAAA